MGACASCLGGRRRDSVEETEESRLLFDDPNSLQYGSFGDHQMAGQNDPLEAQREIEALQRVVARTSDNMVDIFEIAPTKDAQRSAPTAPYALVGQEARQMRYKSLLSKLSAEDVSAAGARVDWLPDEDEEASDSHHAVPHIRTESSDVLVGNFREAAAAMARCRDRGSWASIPHGPGHMDDKSLLCAFLHIPVSSSPGGPKHITDVT